MNDYMYGEPQRHWQEAMAALVQKQAGEIKSGTIRFSVEPAENGYVLTTNDGRMWIAKDATEVQERVAEIMVRDKVTNVTR